MTDIPGWYVDAMEQNLATLIDRQRQLGLEITELMDLFIDPKTDTEQALTPEQHTETLALCLALCVSRLARINITP